LYGYPLDADYALGYTAYDTMYVDDWGTGVYAARVPSSYAGYGADAGPGNADAGSTNQERTALEALRAAVLAKEGACADTATLEQKRTPKPCEQAGETADSQTGFTLTVAQCKLSNGATLEGKLEVSSTYTASDDACDSATTLTVAYEATYTNLTYVAPDGRKIVLVKLVDTGTYERKLQEPPASVSSRIEAELQRYDAAGTLSSSRTFAGTIDYQISHPPLTILANAKLDATNALDGGKMSAVTVTSLKIQRSCCHPTGGTIVAVGAERTSYEFGPGCGDAKRDGASIQLPDCR
jgi:hypothetical protein